LQQEIFKQSQLRSRSNVNKQRLLKVKPAPKLLCLPLKSWEARSFSDSFVFLSGVNELRYFMHCKQC